MREGHAGALCDAPQSTQRDAAWIFEREDVALTCESQGRLREAALVYASLADRGEVCADWHVFRTGCHGLVRCQLALGEVTAAEQSSRRLERFVLEHEPYGPARVTAPDGGLSHLWLDHAREARAAGALLRAHRAYARSLRFYACSDTQCELAEVLLALGELDAAQATLEQALIQARARWPWRVERTEQKLAALARQRAKTA